MQKDVKKHPLRWFVNRVGDEVIKNKIDLFTEPVKIASEQHAKALWITQKEKGWHFTELKTS